MRAFWCGEPFSVVFQIRSESVKVRGLFKDKMTVAYPSKPEPFLRS
jgi:hypothetical protein